MMKKRLIFTLALAGACFQTGSLFAQNPDSKSYLKASSVARIGDGASSIGDSDRISSGRVASQDIRPVEFRANAVNTSMPSEPLPADTMASYSSPVAQDHSSYQGESCGTGSCGTGSCVQMNCVAPAVVSTGWVEGGALLWWRGGGSTPPLVTRHPNAGGDPVLGAPTEILAGGDQRVGNGLLPGFYAGFGMWLDDSQDLGAGARTFGLFGGGNNTNYTFDGNRSIGVPFFNTSLGVEDAYVVGFNAGAPGINTGSISVATDLDLIGGEIFLRKGLIRNGSSRLDVVGGYLFTKLDDSLILRTNQTNGVSGDGIADGTVTTTADQFSGSNTFHGGELGLLAQGSRGKWFLSSGTKFAIGNMNQKVSVSGLYNEVPPPNVAPPFADDRGLFAQSSNSGRVTRNGFAFIPQIDLKLGYQMNTNLRFDVGYSFMYFSNVVLAGNQIDRNIDIAAVFAAPAAPTTKFETDSLILHGINLGATYSY